MSPAESSPSELRGGAATPLSVYPHLSRFAISGLICPFVTSGGRFWRTLATCSPGTGMLDPHTPMWADPLTSITRLAIPARSVRKPDSADDQGSCISVAIASHPRCYGTKEPGDRCSGALWVPKTSSGAPTRDDVPERTSVLAERPTSRIR